MNTETANLRSPFAIAILACVSVVLGSGCTSVKMQDFNPGTTHSIGAKTIEKDGLKITVDPFFDPERSETYFKLNTLKEGIAVLHVQLENQTTATTFLIHKENFRLLIGSDAEKRANEEKRDQSSPTGQAVGVTGAALVFGGGSLVALPLAFVGANMMVNASLVKKNFIDKELPNLTLSAGQSIQGFTYYQMPKQQVKSGAMLFRISAPTTTGETSVELEIGLNYEIK